MAKLFLKFEDAVLKEVPLSQSPVTIGRLPDNTIQIDNLAVSGHHAKIYWDAGKYVIEDNNSLNGTYISTARISRQTLKDGDDVVIGKHTISFKDEGFTLLSAQRAPVQQNTQPPMPKLESTVMLDTKQMKERLASHLHRARSRDWESPAPAQRVKAQPPPRTELELSRSSTERLTNASICLPAR